MIAENEELKPELAEEQPEEVEWVIDETTNGDYLSMMYWAVEICETVTTMTKADEQRKAKIQRKALKITEKIIDEVYNDFFDRDEE
jgi:hypothetical protein